jgi:hypothetical protein
MHNVLCAYHGEASCCTSHSRVTDNRPQHVSAAVGGYPCYLPCYLPCYHTAGRSRYRQAFKAAEEADQQPFATGLNTPPYAYAVLSVAGQSANGRDGNSLKMLAEAD